MSLAIFMSDPARVLSAPLPITSSSCADNAANLFGCEVNGWPVNSAIFLAARSLGFYFASLGVPFEGPPDSYVIAVGAASLCFGLALGLVGATLASRRALLLEPARMIQMESAP